MKNNTILAIIFALLIGISSFFFIKNQKSTIDENISSFSIADTSKITTCIIINKADTLVLTKVNANNWRYNGGFSARKGAVDILMDILTRVNVKSAVGKDDNDKITSKIQASGIKIAVYQGRTQLLVYQAYADTLTRLTYLMVPGSNRPFIVELPGFYGNIVAAFTTNTQFWRDKNLARLIPSEIKSITLQQSAHPEQSFCIENTGNSRFDVKQLTTGKIVNDVNPDNIEMYILSFKQLSLEGFFKPKAEVWAEISNLKPLYILIIKDVYGNETVAKTFARKMKGKEYKSINEQVDINNFYILLNDKELALAKYVNFDPVLKDLSWFSTR